MKQRENTRGTLDLRTKVYFKKVEENAKMK